MDGNWQWGKFFYNVTSALSTISGCKMASDGKSLTLMGVANSQPIMLEINGKDGSINKFLSLELVGLTDSNVPTIVTYGAILHDKEDFFEKKEKVYEAFLMDSKVQLLRVETQGQQTPKIDWSWELNDYTSTQNPKDLVRRKDPAIITTDPIDPTVFYLSGRFEGKGSVMKFQKRDGKMDWWVKFERITSIRSVIEVPNEDYFYGCGDYQLNEDETGIQDMATQATYQAVIFKMEKDGTVNWIQEIGGSNPVAG